ncbi:MAG: DUF3455 domain-containing protein [Candidatus Binatia bacterium]
MTHCDNQRYQSLRRSVLRTCLTFVVGIFVVSMSQEVYAHPHLNPPPVPANLQVPAGHKVFLVGHAVGTQQYFCKFSGTSYAWTFFGPQATLFKDNGKQILTHFLSPNPWENGTARATWQDAKDSSTVWATPIASSSDPALVEPGAVPWLLLEVGGDQSGLTDGDYLTRTTFIQRLNTSGGVAPVTGCAAAPDIGAKALVPYMADYFFYESTDSE